MGDLDRVRFATRDPEEAHGYLRATHADSTMRITGRRDGFRFTHSATAAGPVVMITMRHTMGVEHVVEPSGQLLVGRVVTGAVEREVMGDAQRVGVDDVFLVAAPDRPYTARWDALALQVIAIDEAVLADVAGVAGYPPGALRFTDFREPDPGAAGGLRRTVDFVAAELRTDRFASPLVADAAARLLAATVLQTFPNTASTTDAPPTDVVVARPAVVRRAIAHIEAHAHEPIGMTEVAEAVRVSPRTLQVAFRRHLATTPTAYLRTVRLQLAHDELLATDPGGGVTVIDIALRWGFAHQGRFAAAYRLEFGRSPSATLHG